MYDFYPNGHAVEQQNKEIIRCGDTFHMHSANIFSFKSSPFQLVHINP